MASEFSQRLVPVPCADLVPGLYVAELDRPWLQTPYPAHGFRLGDAGQIAELRRHCNYVYVDPARGALPASDFGADDSATGLTRRLPAARPGPEPTPLAAARRHLGALADGLAGTLAAGREGLPLPVATLQALAPPVVAAMDRDADTLPWLLATELKVGLLARRAIGTGLLLGQFARRLGHGDGEAADLLLAGLLLDIGKLAVPVPILAKPGPLSGAEHAFVRRHVRRGLYLARTAADLPETVEDAIIGHHERLDGSGYPRGCAGTAIPLAARIAGIADTYDALTLDRRYAAALPASGALRSVSRGRGRRFDTTLLRAFVRALGVFPTGGWVQLADGRLGIVRAQTPGDPLRPRVALVADSAGRALPEPGRLWSPSRRGAILRGIAPRELRLAAGIVGPALLGAATA